MSRKLKILLLFDSAGNPPADQDFTEQLKNPDWKTEADILKTLNDLGHDVRMLGIYDNPHLILQEVKEHPPELIFNLVEHFRDNPSLERNIIALLELLGIPFTGCGLTGVMLCKNKGLTKKILSYHRIDVPDFEIFYRDKPIHRPKKLSFPILIKPLREQASYGISQASFVESDQDFNERIRFTHEKLNRDAIAEEYIEGRELYVSILGNDRLEVFPLREIKFTQIPEEEPKFATYRAKWDDNYRKRWGIKNVFADNLPDGLQEKVEKICKKVYRVLQICGYARLDLRLTPEGKIIILEANPNPMLAEEEDFAESARKQGLDYPTMVQRILNLALSGNAVD